MSFVVGVLAIFIIPKEPKNQNSSGEPRAGIDWAGAFLFTSGLLLLLIGLSEGVSQGWKSPLVIVALITSVLMLVSFIFWEHHLEISSGQEPLMRVSTFKHRRFSIALVIVCLFSSGFTNFLVYLTY